MATFLGVSILGRGYDYALTNKPIALIEMKALWLEVSPKNTLYVIKRPASHKNTL
jgi:hypothetical protein